MKRSVGSSRRHLLWRNFWALPCSMIAASVLLTCGLLWLDDAGAAVRVNGLGWPFAMTAGTAQELASGLVTIYAAFSTLYFSITLLVLTLAASNLGVRLIDRWISDLTIRFTLGLLLSLLAASLILLFSVDADAPPERVPRLALTVVTIATVLTLAWMSNALHHLGRMVHVDTSIAQLGRDAARGVARTRHLGAPGGEAGERVPIRACSTGYVDEIDCGAILSNARARNAYVCLMPALGDYMMEGEAIGWVAGDSDGQWVTDHIVCTEYRNDSSGPSFESNLLVEVAARALSPGINDFYTALACCDRLASICAAAIGTAEAPDWLADDHGVPRLRLPREKVTVFLDGPLKALREAAAAYPSVSIHMIELIGRIPVDAGADETVRAFLLRHAEAFAEHAGARAETEADRRDIAEALRRMRVHLG